MSAVSRVLYLLNLMMMAAHVWVHNWPLFTVQAGVAALCLVEIAKAKP